MTRNEMTSNKMARNEMALYSEAELTLSEAINLTPTSEADVFLVLGTNAR